MLKSNVSLLMVAGLAAIALLTVFMPASFVMAQEGFKEDQLRYSRVRTAYQEKEDVVKKLFKEQNVSWSPPGIFIRVFKKENELELWARPEAGDSFRKVTTYEVCKHFWKIGAGPASGALGPKRQQGDEQIPEGFYQISGFNPASNFYLSLRVNYPNRSDKILGVQGSLGGDIFIHGSCATIGCLPITTDKIKELYLVAVEARENGQSRIPVHIFPTRLDDAGLARLRENYSDQPELIAFWENLKPVYDYFESRRQVPDIYVDNHGRYHLQKATTKEIQAMLNQLGINAGPVDGIWGPRTRAGVRQFQQRHNLSQTGCPDEATISKLLSPDIS